MAKSQSTDSHLKVIKSEYNKWTPVTMKHFGQMIFSFLNIVDWSQMDLARELGVSKQLVNKWIKDNTSKVDLVTGYMISEVIHGALYRYFNYDTGDILIRSIDSEDTEFQEALKKTILQRWDSCFLHIIGYYKESPEDQHMVRHTALQKLEEIRDNNMAEMWNSYQKDFEESGVERLSNLVFDVDFDINQGASEMLVNLKDYPIQKSLTGLSQDELNKVSIDAFTNFQSSWKDLIRTTATREVIENTTALKILKSEDIYDLVYNYPTAEASDIVTAEKIWEKNASSVTTDKSFTYMAWQQRKYRRYQMLMSLFTLFNAENNFEYNLDDPNLTAAMNANEPVLHFNSNQIKNLKGKKRTDLAYWIFGKEPKLDEENVDDIFKVNSKGGKNAK